MRGYVGVTDSAWYRFLAARPQLNEVNFWRPSGGRAFHSLSVGEPFFFKTHHPHNRVVGGGFYSDFVALRLAEAWDLFGEANGAENLDQMRARIAHCRRNPIGELEDPEIGCIFVRDVRFFSPDEVFTAPPGFASNIVQGKRYELAEPSVEPYFADLLDCLLGGTVELDLSQPWHRDGPVFGDPRLSPQRLGQRSFQAVMLAAYHRRCAITGTKISPVLQAAHIRPVTAGGQHRIDNGLLLRSDVHTMFDRGYLAIDPHFKLQVSPRLRTDFGNGEQYYAKAGQLIEVPERRVDRPAREFLEWHLDEVFRPS
jgi:putative restriction endonuclease